MRMWEGRGRRRCPHPVGSGVAQVFHDVLVVLQLLLVAEVEEAEDEEGQDDWEVESGEDHRVEKRSRGWPCRWMK